MKIIVITGRIATGKSTVLQQFEFIGAKSFSSDDMVNSIYSCDIEFFIQIKELYPQIIEHGKINKNKLSNLVFNSKKALNELEKLIYPKLEKKRRRIIRNCYLNNIKLVVFEIPLLFEKKLDREFKIIVTTTCNNELQKRRYLKRKNTNLKKYYLINSKFVEDSKRFKNSSFVVNTGNGMNHSLLSIKKIIKER